MAALENRVAFITGAGSGIGEAAAVLLAKNGARIAAVGRTANELERVCHEIGHCGSEVITVVADVSSPEQIEAGVKKVLEKWNSLDIVFANAGINGVWAPLDELTPEEWDKTLSINLKGTFLTVKYALPALRVRGGSVIITSSVNGTRMFSNTGATAYSCSKAGQVAFCKMAALELAREKIRVNVICPGAIKTKIHQKTEKRDLERVKVPVEFPEGSIPLTEGKPGEAENVAELVLFLASDASSLITGTEVWIDGGESLLEG
jgi:NAD(P)-dependent dehydrogenase (short-subunit alcohol dehydrogenase family)